MTPIPANKPGAYASVLWLLGTRFLSKALGFVFLAVYARALSPGELALIPLYFAAANAGLMLFGLGTPVLLLREIPRLQRSDAHMARRLMLTVLLVGTVSVSLTAALATLGLEPLRLLLRLEDENSPLIRWLPYVIGVGGWYLLLGKIMESLREFRRLAVMRAVYDTSLKSCGFAGFVLGGVDGLIAGMLLGSAASNLAFTVIQRRWIFVAVRPYPLGRLLRRSWPFYFSGHANYLKNRGDVFVVAALLGPAALGVYYLAQRIFGLIQLVVVSMAEVITPNMAALRAEGREAAVRAYRRLNRIVPALFAPFVATAVILCRPFVHVVGGDQYLDSAVIPAALLCAAAGLQGFLAVQIRTIVAVARPVDQLLMAGSELALQLGLLFALSLQYGVAGSAAARAMAMLAVIVIGRNILRRRLDPGRLSREAPLFALAGAGLALALFLVQETYYSLWLVPFYVIALWTAFSLLVALFMSPDDLAMLRKAMPRQLAPLVGLWIRGQRLLGAADASRR